MEFETSILYISNSPSMFKVIGLGDVSSPYVEPLLIFTVAPSPIFTVAPTLKYMLF